MNTRPCSLEQLLSHTPQRRLRRRFGLARPGLLLVRLFGGGAAMAEAPRRAGIAGCVVVMAGWGWPCGVEAITADAGTAPFAGKARLQ